MFNLFNEKCPVCKMELKKGVEYPEAFGKKFCSENCKEKYQKQLTEKKSEHSHQGCC